MVRMPRRMSSRRGWGEEEKFDQTALTASRSSTGRASSDWKKGSALAITNHSESNGRRIWLRKGAYMRATGVVRMVYLRVAKKERKKKGKRTCCSFKFMPSSAMR